MAAPPIPTDQPDPLDVVTDSDGGLGQTVRHLGGAGAVEWLWVIIGPVGGAMTEGFAGRFDGRSGRN